MSGFLNGSRGIALVILFLFIQSAALYLSIEVASFQKISVFCTAPASNTLAILFTFLHLLFFALAFVGIASLWFARLRPFYIGFLCAGLALLPIQAHFVGEGTFWCDFP
ncbi:MAG: hypothetical protein ACK5NN_14375 [Sphingomonadaceae bacterium]